MMFRYAITVIMSLILFFHLNQAHAEAYSSTYERVMETGTIRCGYVTWPPYVMTDPNTGGKRGVFFDIMEELGRRMDLEIKWTAEVNWGTFIQDLKTGRYDMLCSGGWNSAEEGRHIAYSRPVYYTPVGAWVRKDEDRFNGKVSNLNSQNVTVASTDGSLVTTIAEDDFPKAEIKTVPNIVDDTILLQNVSTGKADVTFLDTYVAGKYIENNPGTLKNIAAGDPVRIFPTSLVMPMDAKLKMMIDAGLAELEHSGFIDKVLDKYSPRAGTFWRVEDAFQRPEAVDK